MIVKEREPSHSSDPRIRTGENAERQMAHYLKRAFGDASDVYVFNDLRLVLRDEVAQIDHLVVHRWGFAIVESKSVTGRLRVNDQLEFVRVFGHKQVGIPSPIEQARRQAMLLRDLLHDHRERLRDRKVLGLMQGGFRQALYDLHVAISDQGVIDRGRRRVPGLMKADQVPGIIAARIETGARTTGLTGFILANEKQRKEAPAWVMTRDEMIRVRRFLLDMHTPRSLAASQQESPEEVEPINTQPFIAPHASAEPLTPRVVRPKNLPVFLCTHCHSENVAVRYGYSYYLACADCSKNTPLKLSCPACDASAKPRKRRNEFFAECNACNEWRLVFITK